MSGSLGRRLLLATFLFLTHSFADDGINTGIHHHYRSPRALGMGEAFVAAVDDYSALFYNPAALARREDGQINLSFDFSWSKSFFDFAKKMDDASKVTGTDAQKQQAYLNVLQDLYGSNYTIGANLPNGIWVRPGWGVAVLPMDFTSDLTIHKGPTVNVRAYGDSTIAFGYGRDYKGIPGRLSLGTTLKFVNRAFINRSVTLIDLAVDSKVIKKEDARDGYTLDADLGALYTPELPTDGLWGVFRLSKPTFGVVVRNVLDYGFGQSFNLINKTTVEAPEKLNRTIDLGSKWEFPQLGIFSGRGVLDFRDIMHPYVTFRKSAHIGMEFDWRMASWWKGSYRVGVNQGYFTAGVSALLFLFNLDLVTYGEDIGSSDSPKENRVYMVRMNIDW